MLWEVFGFRVDWNFVFVHPSNVQQVEVLSKQKCARVCILVVVAAHIGVHCKSGWKVPLHPHEC